MQPTRELAEGETLSQRIGVLVHRGDVETGRVAERYEQYVAGEFCSPNALHRSAAPPAGTAF